MANFREHLIAGGRAYIDSGDVAAVIVRGDDFDALAPPDRPLRLLLSGCGETVDIFGVSVTSLFGPESDAWLDAMKFQRLRMRGGHAFIAARHIVGVLMSGDSDQAATSQQYPLRVLIRGAPRDAVVGWGLSAFDFLFWMLESGRKVRVDYIDKPKAAA